MEVGEGLGDINQCVGAGSLLQQRSDDHLRCEAIRQNGHHINVLLKLGVAEVCLNTTLILKSFQSLGGSVQCLLALVVKETGQIHRRVLL